MTSASQARKTGVAICFSQRVCALLRVIHSQQGDMARAGPVFLAIACGLALVHCISGSPSMPTLPLRNAAAPGTNLPAVGLGTGAYGMENEAYGAWPECMDEAHPPVGPPAPGCGENAIRAVEAWLRMGGRRLDCANSCESARPAARACAARDAHCAPQTTTRSPSAKASRAAGCRERSSSCSPRWAPRSRWATTTRSSSSRSDGS
jgi:hypothetical protein